MRDQATTKLFPEGFYWGAATASYQVEGGIENCDWADAARGGKVPVCGAACDHYNRYEADFDIAKELGHNCHRISIEWARIEPEEGKFDEREIGHYLAVLAALRARRLKPFITMWHFTLPQWFADKGGFDNPEAPEMFARYCGYVARKLGNDCRHFATMNEPTVFASLGWIRGDWPPFRTNDYRGYWRIMRTLARAHHLAYSAIKSAAFGAEVGIVHHVVYFHANWNPINKLRAWVMNWLSTHRVLSLVITKCDSIGVNYYQHKKFGDTRTYKKTDMGWDVYPEGLCAALLMLKRYNRPLWVSEAGVADAKDAIRADYITRLVRCMHEAIARGADVRGYMYWSLLDNYEWAAGYDKRFGLVEIDYNTLERKVRPSAYVYKKIIEQNGLVE